MSVPSIGVSRYSESYYAVVLRTEGSGIGFAAHGPDDLRDPGESCLITPDGQELAPTVDIDLEASGYSLAYVGTMTFASRPSGSEFLYSCSGDYTSVPL